MIHGIKIDSNETSVETTDLRGVQEDMKIQLLFPGSKWKMGEILAFLA